MQSYFLLLYIPVRAHLQCWETKNDSTLFLPQDGTNRPLITVIMHLDHKMATNVVKMARRWHQRAKCTKPKQYALVLDQPFWNYKAQQAHAGSYSSEKAVNARLCLVWFGCYKTDLVTSSVLHYCCLLLSTTVAWIEPSHPIHPPTLGPCKTSVLIS